MDHLEEAILLLAAGNSSRMGQAKQLLQYDGQTLIAHLLELLCAQQRSVYVVLGARQEAVGKIVDTFPVDTIINNDWQKGMGASLKTGLRHILERQDSLRKLLCVVVDQVYLSQQILDAFWRVAKTEELIAARYADGEIGVPACIGRKYFPDLLDLEDSRGAKPLFRQYAADVYTVDFPKGGFDLDYPEDWELFLAHLKG